MQYRAFEPGIEVIGQTVYSVVDAFVFVKHVPSRILLDQGIGTKGDDGIAVVEPKAWYSQEAWLRAFERIATDVGDDTLFEIGRKIPENAIFPAWVDDVHSAIRSINVAYHLNHRKNGQVMFDPETETMREGIGYYGYEPVEGQSLIRCECRNPYPCSFDHGIVTAMAQKLEPGAEVTHAAGPCRKTGDDACTYEITW